MPTANALSAAAEINTRWHECIGIEHLLPADCPSDEEVAGIIEKHLPSEEESHA